MIIPDVLYKLKNVIEATVLLTSIIILTFSIGSNNVSVILCLMYVILICSKYRTKVFISFFTIKSHLKQEKLIKLIIFSDMLYTFSSGQISVLLITEIIRIAYHISIREVLTGQLRRTSSSNIQAALLTNDPVFAYNYLPTSYRHATKLDIYTFKPEYYDAVLDNIKIQPYENLQSCPNVIFDGTLTDNQQSHLRKVQSNPIPLAELVNRAGLKDELLSDVFQNKDTNTSTRKKLDIDATSVLVCGGVGSIGTELVEILSSESLTNLVIFDTSELGIYEASERLKPFHVNIVTIVGDICNYTEVQRVLNEYSIDTVFHAAAQKHVPQSEVNPHSTFRVNVVGTSVLLQACENSRVNNFVLISTDKAVSPTSLMGATKCLAEQLTLYSCDSITNKRVVRFGNVIDSSGSVLPKFISQLRSGKNLTVTSREMTRYFMTIPEAASLVISSLQLPATYPLVILDMKEPYNIYEIATKLIAAYKRKFPRLGLRSQIDLIGLRAGEKEYEELYYSDSIVKNTEGFIIVKPTQVCNLTEITDLIDRYQDFTKHELITKVISITQYDI